MITAIVVMQSTADTGSLESTLRLAWQRLIGTMTGAILALVIHVLFQPTYIELIFIIFEVWHQEIKTTYIIRL